MILATSCSDSFPLHRGIVGSSVLPSSSNPSSMERLARLQSPLYMSLSAAKPILAAVASPSFKPPSPLAPWQLAQSALYNCWPSATTVVIVAATVPVGVAVFVGVDVTLSTVEGTGVAVDATVAVGTALVVGVLLPPQAAKMGNRNARARIRTTNLVPKLLCNCKRTLTPFNKFKI